MFAGALVCGALAPGAARAQIIDTHMHAPRAQEMSEWRAAMDELGVRRAVLIGAPAQLESADRTRFVPSLMFPCEGGRAPNIGFPCFADDAEFPTVEEVRAWVRAGRVAALGEINAQYMGVAPDDPRLEPFYALAEELDIPVGIHLGIGPPGAAYEGRQGFPPRKSPNYRGEAGSPLALESVLIRHPNLRLYVMHAAWPMRDEMMYMLYMHPQLYVDVSVLQWAIPRNAYYSYLRDLVDAGFANRIMFGSDGGVRHLREGVQAIRDADFLTEEQKRAILHDNAARFFRIEE
jgi:hypothetical protein